MFPFIINKNNEPLQNSSFVRLVDVKDAFQKEVEFKNLKKVLFLLVNEADVQYLENPWLIGYIDHLLDKFNSFQKVDEFIHSDGQKQNWK